MGGRGRGRAGGRGGGETGGRTDDGIHEGGLPLGSGGQRGERALELHTVRHLPGHGLVEVREHRHRSQTGKAVSQASPSTGCGASSVRWVRRSGTTSSVRSSTRYAPRTNMCPQPPSERSTWRSSVVATSTALCRGRCARISLAYCSRSKRFQDVARNSCTSAPVCSRNRDRNCSAASLPTLTAVCTTLAAVLSSMPSSGPGSSPSTRSPPARATSRAASKVVGGTWVASPSSTRPRTVGATSAAYRSPAAASRVPRGVPSSVSRRSICSASFGRAWARASRITSSHSSRWAWLTSRSKSISCTASRAPR